MLYDVVFMDIRFLFFLNKTFREKGQKGVTYTPNISFDLSIVQFNDLTTTPIKKGTN